MSVNYPAIQKNTDSQTAIDVPVDVSSFNGRLSASDIDVQTALETLDNHLHDEVEVTTSGTANVDIETATIVRQTASATTTFTNVSTGSSITIVNDSLSINTITNQLWGETNWLLYPEESVTIYYDGAEFKTK